MTTQFPSAVNVGQAAMHELRPYFPLGHVQVVPQSCPELALSVQVYVSSEGQGFGVVEVVQELSVPPWALLM